MLDRVKALFLQQQQQQQPENSLAVLDEESKTISQKNIRLYAIFLLLSTLPVHLKLLSATPGIPEIVGICLLFCSAIVTGFVYLRGKYVRIDNLLWAYSTIILAVFAGVKNYRLRITTELSGYRDPEERTVIREEVKFRKIGFLENCEKNFQLPMKNVFLGFSYKIFSKVYIFFFNHFSGNSEENEPTFFSKKNIKFSEFFFELNLPMYIWEGTKFYENI